MFYSNISKRFGCLTPQRSWSMESPNDNVVRFGRSRARCNGGSHAIQYQSLLELFGCSKTPIITYPFFGWLLDPYPPPNPQHSVVGRCKKGAGRQGACLICITAFLEELLLILIEVIESSNAHSVRVMVGPRLEHTNLEFAGVSQGEL